eukprot:253337-Pleurochrysis_carterae.AAC.1
MFRCVEALLEKPDNFPYRFPPKDDPDMIEDAVEKLEKLLLKNLGPDYKLLIHVDEHFKMCYRSEESPAAESGAAFSRGAMSVLASTPGVAVVATYTHRPELPASESSA